ncbi:helix-turn-helix domain-containing protein [Paraburkholderia fungorum]|uniref:helix-turn-helix domain-containing protein n=1 Tax=Paraburkholderia fungorum TaxID=134537 RepID=UPI0038BE0FBE
MEHRLETRKELGSEPIAEGWIGGESSIYVERYLFQKVERSVSGLNATVFVAHFDGAHVHEGDAGQARTMSLPCQAWLIPPNCATHWHYAGAVDFAIFYLPDESCGITGRLRSLACLSAEPQLLGDPLVGAAALQLANELQKGDRADSGFMERLAGVMLEQVCRVLSTSVSSSVNATHIHFSRLLAVFGYIREHLTDDLSTQVLADCAKVSRAHFCRLFQEVTGGPPHRYVLAARLEQARTMLTTSNQPIGRIAQDCGFSSQSHFTSSFRRAHGTTPAQFRAHLKRDRAIVVPN